MNAAMKSSPDALQRARELLDRSDEVPSLDALARQVGLSPSHLQRMFRRAYGVSPAEYGRARRFGELKRALREGASITDAIYDAGFGSASRVYEHSDRLLGMPPARYARGAAGMAIRYTTLACPLGRVLVAATGRGLCAVNIGESDEELLRQLREEFPRAQITRVDAGRDEWLSVVVARIAGQFGKAAQGEAAKLPPLDIAATAFQWRVWDALTRIPVGETRSYGEVARMIGAPNAARAVGRACGSNKLALIVPCHRVVREDGTPGGWRWGAARKQRLLEREAGKFGSRSP
ncbi:MAG TPA: methylated-DNA--[protein]-cysteine S-methyltransferase [Rhodanobacteraceae bacterium]|nr:methylated-DNA--[protein]-cysteine S-methyltransferase [Rhodanobacteraceae bacterium]